MNVLSAEEGVDEILIAGEMRHDAQLYLRVVGGKEELALIGNKSLAHLFALSIPHGNVLQIRIGRGEASGGCDGLIEGGMYVPRLLVDEQREGVDIGAEQFLEAAVLKDFLHDGMAAPQALQDFFRCDILPGFRLFGFVAQVETVEEHFSHLSRRGDIESGHSGELVYFFLQSVHSPGVETRGLLQAFRVDAGPNPFHFQKHGRQRHLDGLEKVPKVFFLQFPFQALAQFGQTLSL